MIATLRGITRENERSYRVVLEEASGGIRTFELEVEEGNIQVVKWQDDLAQYLKQNLASASLLFETVLAFHRARRLVVPDD